MQNIKNKFLSTFLMSLGLIILVLSCYVFYRNILDSALEKEISLNKTEIFHFVDTNIKVSETTQNQWTIIFKENYFAPWNNPTLHFSKQKIYEEENRFIGKFTKNPGWGLDKHPYSNLWIKDLIENMQINSSFNTNKYAITTRATDLRILPTQHPSFTNWVDPGEGFPFDNLQESNLHINLPIYVLHTSKDAMWSLVITAEKTYGWVSNNDIAFVDPPFIKEWQNGDFVVSMKDSEPLLQNDVFQGYLKIGTILPISREGQDEYAIKFAYRNENGAADIKNITVTKNSVVKWPMVANAKTIAKIANELNDKQYGWGGILEARDCSALVRDIFITFGYWLPRNSSDLQSKNSIHIGNLSSLDKEKKIINSATPFLSLLWFRGHVMLYIGHNKKETYSFHSIWGLRTHELIGKDGRSIIGRALVQKNNTGKNKKLWLKHTLLDKVTRIIPIS